MQIFELIQEHSHSLLSTDPIPVLRTLDEALQELCTSGYVCSIGKNDDRVEFFLASIANSRQARQPE